MDCNANAIIENMITESKFKTQEMALACPYNAHITYINSKLNYINQSIDFYSSKYINLLILKTLTKKRAMCISNNFARHVALRLTA